MIKGQNRGISKNLFSMKTKPIESGNIKVWFDREEEFTIVGKNEPLIDTLIDANLLTQKYSEIFVKEVMNAGLDHVHGVQIAIDDMLQSQMDKMEVSKLDMIFDEFNLLFKTHLKYHRSSNGLVSIMFGEFNDYQEFLQDYFGAFLLKLFAFRVDIIKSEEKDETIKGISAFISKFANGCKIRDRKSTIIIDH
jgi:hypothetical protein